MGCSTSKPPEIEVTIPDGSVKVDNKSPATEINDVKVVNDAVVKEGVEALKEAEKVQQKDADNDKLRKQKEVDAAAAAAAAALLKKKQDEEAAAAAAAAALKKKQDEEAAALLKKKQEDAAAAAAAALKQKQEDDAAAAAAALKKKQDEEATAAAAAAAALLKKQVDEAAALKKKEEDAAAAAAAVTTPTIQQQSKDATLSAATKEPLPVPSPTTGYLEKEGKNFKSWKRRFFILEAGTINYFEKETFKNSNIGASKCGDTIYLKDYVVSKPADNRILLQGNASASGARKLLVQVANESIQAAWAEAFQRHIDYCDSL